MNIMLRNTAEQIWTQEEQEGRRGFSVFVESRVILNDSLTAVIHHPLNTQDVSQSHHVNELDAAEYESEDAAE